MDDDNEGKSGGFIFGVLVAWFIIANVWGIGGSGKYEGETAEDWYNNYDDAEASYEESEQKYQEFHDCVENYALESGYISANDLYYGCF